MRKKAQSEIISIVLIIAISVGLVSAAYTWGLPLIEKRTSETKANRVASYFDQTNANSLPSTIEFIANNGGEDNFVSTVDGLWILNTSENSIQFTFFSKVTKFCAAGTSGCPDWIPLTSGASCPPTAGEIKDKSSVVCARANTKGNGYETSYKVWFREIDESATSGYKIVLEKHDAGQSSSTGKSVRITFNNREKVSNGKTLINTKIKILLV